MANAHEGGRRVVIAALAGNAGISIAKFVAAGLTGSASMLAEAVHSVADTANQILLLLGMSLSKKNDPVRHPLGRGKEVYFWAFIVSLLLFFGGGVTAIYQGIEKLHDKEATPGSALPSLIVLGVSIALEGSSFLVAWKQFRKSGSGNFWNRLFGAKDPTVAVVLLEDSAALLGLLIALGAVLITSLTRQVLADAVGSIAIGTLLCMVGAVLARDTHSLLLGEAATAEMRRRTLELAEGTDGVNQVTQILTMHLGPSEILVALKVRFRPGMVLDEVEKTTNRMEERIRAEFPEMTRIFVEADGNYDATRDPRAPSGLKPA